MISAYDIIMERIDEWRKDAVLTTRQCNATESLINRIFLIADRIDPTLDNFVAPELITVKFEEDTALIRLNVHFSYRNKRVILRTSLREEANAITLFHYEDEKLIATVTPNRGNKAIVSSIKQLLK